MKHKHDSGQSGPTHPWSQMHIVVFRGGAPILLFTKCPTRAHVWAQHFHQKLRMRNGEQKEAGHGSNPEVCAPEKMSDETEKMREIVLT